MSSYLNQLVNRVSWHVTHMDRTELLIMMVCVVAVGVLCMRGFGSRKNY